MFGREIVGSCFGSFVFYVEHKAMVFNPKLSGRNVREVRRNKFKLSYEFQGIFKI